MKKAIALLLAFATAFSISTAALADGDPDSAIRIIDSATGSDSASGDIYAGDIAGRAITPFNLIMQDGDLTVDEYDMFFVFNGGDMDGRLLMPGSVITPGDEYTLDIYYATAPTASPTDEIGIMANAALVTKSMLGGGRLRLRTVKGSTSIATVKLEENGSGNTATYQLELTTKSNYGTKINDVEYALEVTGAGTGGSVFTKRTGVAFKVGFEKMPDSELAGYEEGDTVTVYNDRPVITKKQFEDLAKSFNYKAVTIEDDNATWTFTGRVSGMSDANFYNTQEIIPDIVIDNPDVDFKFVNFHGGVKLPTSGEMRIDVSDISGDFESLNLYLSRGGALTPIAATHDRDTDELVFKTNYLGTFIIADAEIATEHEEPIGPDDPNYIPPVDQQNPALPINPNNPITGAVPYAGIASTIGLAALAGAGCLFRKKK